MIASTKGDADSEKPVPTHENVQDQCAVTTALRIATDSAEIAANPISNDDFGREDDEYISGYRLLAALVGIISAFFIVLLDFSIISTVGNTDNTYKLTMYPGSSIISPNDGPN